MIVMSLDPALGGGCATVVAHLGEKLTVLDARTDEGLNRNEQIFDILETHALAYHPAMCIMETDSQQKGIANDERMQQMADRHRFTIRPHLTRGQKMDPIFGVASMDQSFKNGEVRIPYGDQYSQDRMAALVHQLRSWRPDVATKHLTQDLVMALWFIHKYWFEIRKVDRTPAAPAWRPSWTGGGKPPRMR